jgi:pentatricopeptide repeat protein
VVSHSTLIKAHASAGEFDAAVSLLEEMVGEGRVPPTHWTFNPLIDRCARAGEAFNLFYL